MLSRFSLRVRVSGGGCRRRFVAALTTTGPLTALALGLTSPSAACANAVAEDALGAANQPQILANGSPLDPPNATPDFREAPAQSDVAVPPPITLLADPSPTLPSRPALAEWTLAQADTAAQPIPPAEPALDPSDPARTGINPYSPYLPRHTSFGQQVGAVKWELAASLAFLTAVNLPKDIRHGHSFRFQDEGWFGDNTDNLGVDKVAHAYNAFLFSEIMYQRMRRKTGDGPGPAATSALLGLGIQLYGEIFDGFESNGGWSWQDVAFDALGSGISFVRNTVPGLRDKLDFRILIMPNHEVYTPQGKAHFEQQRFLLALKLAGFEGLKRSPLRFVELHAGYYASGFTFDQRAAGLPLRRRPFVGIGINLQELFFPHPTGWLSKAARTTLEYVQVPYTAASVDTHGHVSD